MVRDVAFDRARTQAIAKYVKEFREELLGDLPDESKANSNLKRNELLRLGRVRFASEPESVQRRYFKPSDLQGRPSVSNRPSTLKRPLEEVCECGGCAGVEPDSSRSGGVQESKRASPNSAIPATPAVQSAPKSLQRPFLASDLLETRPCGSGCASTGEGVQVSAPTSSGSGCVRESDGGQRAKGARSEGFQGGAPIALGSAGARELDDGLRRRQRPRDDDQATIGMLSQDEVLPVLAGTLGKLQQLFGHGDGTAVLATSYRIAPFALEVSAPVKVKTAAILSLALKMNLTVENASIQNIWCHVAGAGQLERIKVVEQNIFERLSLDGLEGPYAKERLAMFS